MPAAAAVAAVAAAANSQAGADHQLVRLTNFESGLRTPAARIRCFGGPMNVIARLLISVVARVFLPYRGRKSGFPSGVEDSLIRL